MQRTLPLLGCRRSECLHKVDMGFGVGELLSVLNLQAPVFVGNDVFDEDRFASRFNPEHGFYTGSKL